MKFTEVSGSTRDEIKTNAPKRRNNPSPNGSLKTIPKASQSKFLYNEDLYLATDKIPIKRAIAIRFMPKNELGIRLSKCGRFGIKQVLFENENLPPNYIVFHYKIPISSPDLRALGCSLNGNIDCFFLHSLVAVEEIVLKIARKELELDEELNKDKEYGKRDIELRTYVEKVIKEREKEGENVPISQPSGQSEVSSNLPIPKSVQETSQKNIVFQKIETKEKVQANKDEKGRGATGIIFTKIS